MIASLARLAERYNDAISAYLRVGSEALLTEAYEIGRQAIVDGAGLLDVETIHANALLALALGAPEAQRADLARSAQAFFLELLSPFEMSFRGYREANLRLQRLNETLVRQRDEIAQANRELETFGYSLSHDLRAPLRSIDGFSLALLEDEGASLSERGRSHLDHVRASAQEMSRLIDAMMELARVGHGEVLRVRVDLSATARRIAAQLRATAPDRQVDFVIADGLIVQGDPRLLGALLDNLLGNAWKFTAKRAHAKIELDRAEQPGVFVVRDDGAGFDMAHAARLFGAFQRLHSAREFEGTGIGLATAQRIVRRHRGEIRALGEVGVGASFHFSLGEPATEA